MKRGVKIASTVLAGCLAAAGAARADTLDDAVALAYQTNPTLQNARAQLRGLDEEYVQARAGYRPQVQIAAEADNINGPSTDQLTVKPASASISVVQPLYTGGLVSADVRATEGDIASGREKLHQVEEDLLEQVIQAYVDVRRDVQGLKIAEDNVQVLRHQKEETDAKFAVGEVTRTDVAQAQARLAGAQAQLSTAQAELALTRANYVSVVGQSPGELEPEPALIGLPATVDEALSMTNRNNPNVLSADYAEQAAAARVEVAKAAYRPNVSLRASYGTSGYYGSQNGIFPPEAKDIYQQSYQFSAVATEPLFAGGANASRIRQALEGDNAARIFVESARRQALQAVSQAWNQLAAARANVASDEEQVKADQVAYEGVKEEAKVGLRVTLDILNAEQELQAAELALVDARHDEYVASALVLDAMGQLDVKDLSPATPAYNPVTNFRKVMNKGALPWDPVVAGLDSLGEPKILHPPIPGPDQPMTPAHAAGLRGVVDSSDYAH